VPKERKFTPNASTAPTKNAVNTGSDQSACRSANRICEVWSLRGMATSCFRDYLTSGR